ncbi:hypothetical protein RHMOL_Rhmol07G0190000 [Rhododendron molle]|uniref:Uncharacterized protein n=1 Tax=Rhododendron molle TaxID=49168 RepID=A0ACC0N2Y8_RHOML|nr:hypothetical protein RHMOL_Rhmol07G0190000 [Rhododendron molle]
MHDSLVCNGFKDIFLYIYNQTIMHPLITHTISKPTLYNLHSGKCSFYCGCRNLSNLQKRRNLNFFSLEIKNRMILYSRFGDFCGWKFYFDFSFA